MAVCTHATFLLYLLTYRTIKQVHTIARYLDTSHERCAAMSKVPSTSELFAEYTSASERIGNEVRSLVVSEFTPLFKEDTFLEMMGYHVNYLDGLYAAPAHRLHAPFFTPWLA